MSREELNMHSLTLIPDDTLTLVAKMVFVQVGFLSVSNLHIFNSNLFVSLITFLLSKMIFVLV